MRGDAWTQPDQTRETHEARTSRGRPSSPPGLLPSRRACAPGGAAWAGSEGGPLGGHSVADT